MAGMTVDEFESHVVEICSASSVVGNIVNQNAGLDWFLVRAYLVDESFIDIFYNQKTGKTAFAQVREGCRIFGADNRKGWHWHPYEDPSQHVASPGAISFEEFLGRVEQALK
jgi:hypothetical protein